MMQPVRTRHITKNNQKERGISVMERYEELQMEVIAFESEDVITASGDIVTPEF